MLRQRFTNWIHRRIPKSDRAELKHHNLFILPSQFGVSLLLCVILLFLLGTNYQNNPILLLSYLLLSWGFGVMLLCFFNLNQASITLAKVARVHAGQHVPLSLNFEVKTPRANWCFIASGEKLAELLRVQTNERHQIDWLAKNRGLQNLPQLRLESRYPFGLFVCWSYVRFEQKLCVYPAPQPCLYQRVAIEQEQDNDDGDSTEFLKSSKVKKSEALNFEGIREYQQGESLSRVSWKHIARYGNDTLLAKEFSAQNHQADWLTFQSFSGSEPEAHGSIETLLSQLTFAVMQLHQQKQTFGLYLDGFGHPPLTVPVNRGESHLTQCLEALACYGLGSLDE